MLRTIAAITVVALTAFAVPARAGVEEAEAAYRAGDFATAMREFRLQAEQGDARAQYNLGVMYHYSQGLPQGDYDGMAALWFLLAAEQGHAGAQYNLGVFYANGQGVEQDLAEAALWYRLAARQGLARAEAFLGIMYWTGNGVPQDFIRAFALLNIAVGGDLPEDMREATVEIRDAVTNERGFGPDAVAEAQALSRLWFEDPSLIE